ncbi:MAG: hypothetical protein RR533_08925 [Carnobacterium sp.]
MADYDTTIGIQLNDNFTKAMQNADKLVRTIDSMQLSVKKLSTQLSNLSQVTKQIEKLQTINLSNVNNHMNKLASNVSNLKSSMKNINVSSLTGLSSTLRTLMNSSSKFNISGIEQIKQIPRVMKQIEKLDLNKAENQFKGIANAIDPLLIKLRTSSSEMANLSTIVNSLSGKGRIKTGNSSNKLVSELEKAKSKVKDLGNESTKSSKKINQMFTVGSMIYMFNMSKRIFSEIGNLLKKSIDFVEIENYFSRAMGNMRGEAMKFQNKMGDMFGMAMPDMMKMQATFKNMLGSLGGLSNEISYKLSETVTKMTLDFSSLYNTTIEAAATKFQAALSKQVRPIRSVSGYDITQNVLGGALQSIGIYDRQIGKLNELEKRLMIIITLQQQMARSGAMNDFARTINFSGFVSRDTPNNLVNA